MALIVWYKSRDMLLLACSVASSTAVRHLLTHSQTRPNCAVSAPVFSYWNRFFLPVLYPLSAYISLADSRVPQLPLQRELQRKEKDNSSGI